MKAASVKEIKTALEEAGREDLLKLCLRLIKFKKENKELATYFIFEAGNEAGYVTAVKDSLGILFSDVNTTQLYYAKKNLRKILRVANRYIRYSEDGTTEVEILLYVAEAIKDLKLPMKKSAALLSLYKNLLVKTRRSLAKLHEDLQYDFKRHLETLEDF